ncbi:aluminum resistance protein [Acetivibrio straminisolvens JCM 21531]|uniref:Aluminum resistance protein n=1 Tax=Acetivibrio straminisolvens JCM 21531 TaxID=1294263 RepID=W4V3J8_9FIRM|nr:aluminum resistance protein [Acetivibrio straminisolvens JCM 21531]
MNFQSKSYLKNEFGIDDRVLKIAESVIEEITPAFQRIDSIREFNQYKVIKAMQNNNLSDSHFGGTTGYGYDDRGREVLDDVYRDVFKAEDAMVRHQIVSGTHALAICLFGNLRPQDELLAVTGKPMTHWKRLLAYGEKGEVL